MGRDRAARRWGPLVIVGALLTAACGDDFVVGTETEAGTGTGSSGDPTTGPSTPPTTTPNPTTEPTPTTTTPTTTEPTPTTGDTETSTTTSVTVTGTDTDTDTSTGTSTDTDTDTTTGDEVMGRSVSQTVNGGSVASSPNFRMVFTVGQPTQNQGVYTSANFRLQGGLIGANGNPP